MRSCRQAIPTRQVSPEADGNGYGIYDFGGQDFGGQDFGGPCSGREVDQAIGLQKKLIPVLGREVDLTTVRAEIAQLQLISFCGEDDFRTALGKLVSVISTDLEYDRMYARLAAQAQEWVSRDRNDGWLRGAALGEAEAWLASSLGKTPAPAPLQREFIAASQRERQQELERWRSLYETAEQRRIRAEQNEIRAFCMSSEALFATGSRDGTVRLWSAAGLWLMTLRVSAGQVFQVSFSPDGTTLATTAEEGLLQLWQIDPFDGSLVERLVHRGYAWVKDYLTTHPPTPEA